MVVYPKSLHLILSLARRIEITGRRVFSTGIFRDCGALSPEIEGLIPPRREGILPEFRADYSAIRGALLDGLGRDALPLDPGGSAVRAGIPCI